VQVTKPTSAAATSAKASPPKDSKADKDAAANGADDEEEGPEVPPVNTLLEFVAWVVLTGHPLGTKAVGDWSKGRGGYLIDELDQVKEASIRVQVCLGIPACSRLHVHLLARCHSSVLWHVSLVL